MPHVSHVSFPGLLFKPLACVGVELRSWWLVTYWVHTVIRSLLVSNPVFVNRPLSEGFPFSDPGSLSLEAPWFVLIKHIFLVFLILMVRLYVLLVICNKFLFYLCWWTMSISWQLATFPTSYVAAENFSAVYLGCGRWPSGHNYLCSIYSLKLFFHFFIV